MMTNRKEESGSLLAAGALELDWPPRLRLRGLTYQKRKRPFNDVRIGGLLYEIKESQRIE
ncbi:hypothetical protein D3H55_01095 [Bacillus salacetis]|uniref:Uncharacterized protein n=1 Tax=Bacillus salacetis TaxID=2315464 RepID=A0A3A1R7L2_9BACI|nr:hypothetical protein D3H55_01095 [Bacillus salacetis]